MIVLGTAYVANRSSSSLSILDTTCARNKGTIRVPYGPNALAHPNSGNRLWFLMGSGPSQVGKVNLLTRQLIASLEVPNKATSIATAHYAPRAYVASWEGEDGFVTIINTLTNSIIRTIRLSFTYPVDITVSPNDQWIYVVSSNPGLLIVINRLTLKKIIEIETAGYSEKVALTADGKRAYVINSEEGHSVSVINLVTNQVIKTINLTYDYPQHIAITPDQKYAYISHPPENRVSIIALATNTLVKTFTCLGRPGALAMTADNRYVYMVQEEKNRVAILRRSTGTFIKTISVGNNPVDIVYTSRNL